MGTRLSRQLSTIGRDARSLAEGLPFALAPGTNTPQAQVPFMALTATATETVRQDIKRSLHLRDARQTLTSFNRANLYLDVRRKGASVVDDLYPFLSIDPADPQVCLFARLRQQTSVLL